MPDDPIYRAVCALREAEGPNAPAMQEHWAVLYRAIQSYARRLGGGGQADRDDTASESWIKLRRSLRRIEANDPAGVRSYIKKIVFSTHIDLVRARQRRRERFGESFVRAEAGEGPLVETQSDSAADPRANDPDALAPFEDALWDRVDEHLAAGVRPHARSKARERAYFAYERIVRERPADELRAEAGADVKADAFYQWVHRGREVLIAVTQTWVDETGGEGDEGAFARQLLAILEERVRRDAGVPRPERRKKKKGGGEGGGSGSNKGGAP